MELGNWCRRSCDNRIVLAFAVQIATDEVLFYKEEKVGKADWFTTFCFGLQVRDGGTISQRYKGITRRLNLDFRNSTSETANSLYVGSYGRNTAIQGFSDLDMIFSRTQFMRELIGIVEMDNLHYYKKCEILFRKHTPLLRLALMDRSWKCFSTTALHLK